MCKSTEFPIQAAKAEVNVAEDNSTSFVNIHVPSMTYLAGFFLLVLVLVFLWRLWVRVKERRGGNRRLPEIELYNISKSVHDNEARVSRVVTVDGEDLKVAVLPSSKGASKSVEGPAGF